MIWKEVLDIELNNNKDCFSLELLKGDTNRIIGFVVFFCLLVIDCLDIYRI
jgi:hypothetical protein